jgi:hypothetical protein
LAFTTVIQLCNLLFCFLKRVRIIPSQIYVGGAAGKVLVIDTVTLRIIQTVTVRVRVRECRRVRVCGVRND